MSRRGSRSWIARGWLRAKRRPASSCSNANSVRFTVTGSCFAIQRRSARWAAASSSTLGRPERGRRWPDRLVSIAALAAADPKQSLLSLLSGDPGWLDLDRFALARGLTAEAAAALWHPLNFRRVEAGGTSFGFGWHKWQALEVAIMAALADYHKKAPDSPGLEQDRLRRALDIRLPVPAFAPPLRRWPGIVSLGARGRGSSCQVTRSV